MDILEKFFGPVSAKVETKISLFKDDNENGGILIKATFITELQAAHKLRPSFVTHTKTLIDLMLAKRRLAGSPQQSDENGISVTWCRFKYGNTEVRLCVPNISGMEELINGYAIGKVIVNQSFDELMLQAAELSNQES